MDPHRSSYPDESESRWYRGEQQYTETGAQPRYEPPADEAGYRTSDRWAAGRGAPGAQPTMGGQIGQWSGDATYAAPADVHQRDQTQHRDPTTTREPARPQGRGGRPARTPTDPGRAKRTAAAAAMILAAGVAALPVLRVLLDSAFASPPSASGVISSVLVLLGLPLGVIGLHGVATGAGRSPDAPASPRPWLHPPAAYLTVALTLFVAAGLAAS